ncbi:hypothetical protein PHYPSEUDO_004822 [Phytophthora pseudosyringae]|uniref:Uncharacterized protein n=1 Tax=Phytophthora pseudosyringae TaxID=221518 RepID=A0A8T1VMH4_9STRA|nr:hypothetical protein PHYPSEUDO_004822 [Phytophthora pseudosyringae]
MLASIRPADASLHLPDPEMIRINQPISGTSRCVPDKSDIIRHFIVFSEDARPIGQKRGLRSEQNQHADRTTSKSAARSFSTARVSSSTLAGRTHPQQAAHGGRPSHQKPRRIRPGPPLSQPGATPAQTDLRQEGDSKGFPALLTRSGSSSKPRSETAKAPRDAHREAQACSDAALASCASSPTSPT